ncbi:MAG: hypothetical protein JWM89_3255 [Acidimicrobiales bacterium]|nr:hypothetical protein [Acidimicrobiales bacterium]
MTDPALPPLSDEDLSAALDGEASADVVARIAADPEAQARSATLAAAAEAIGTSPPSLDATAVDALVAGALDAIPATDGVTADDDPANDGPSDDGPAGDGDGVVMPLAAGRRRRTAPSWLVAAVVLAFLAVGLGLVWSGRGSDSVDRQTVASQASSRSRGPSSSADRSAGTSKTGANWNSSSTTTGASNPRGQTASDNQYSPASNGELSALPAAAQDLGQFPTPASLRKALAVSFSSTRTKASYGGATRAPSAAAVERCGTQVQVTLALKGGPLHRGYATVDGKQVLVYEFRATSVKTGKPTRLVAAVGRQSCDAVLTFER